MAFTAIQKPGFSLMTFTASHKTGFNLMTFTAIHKTGFSSITFTVIHKTDQPVSNHLLLVLQYSSARRRLLISMKNQVRVFLSVLLKRSFNKMILSVSTFITINAPVVFMERDVMDFWREICITRASYGTASLVPFQGPKKS